MPDTWTCPTTSKVFKTGATPSSRLSLLRAAPHIVLVAPPVNKAYVPKSRNVFNNSSFGDCVTAEEAFAQTCVHADLDANVLSPIAVAWARSHGVLNGAALDQVLDWMAEKGFQVGAQLYNAGPKSSVDYSNEIVLQSAIASGPVKIAIAAGALPGGAGSNDGWYKLGSNNNRTDHAVTLCGYGTAEWCYQQLGLPLPSGLPGATLGYLLYTWATIGFVDHPWIMGTVDEAWLRNPTSVGVPPFTPPVPIPPVPPTPGPNGNVVIEFTLASPVPAGDFVGVLIPKATP